LKLENPKTEKRKPRQTIETEASCGFVYGFASMDALHRVTKKQAMSGCRTSSCSSSRRSPFTHHLDLSTKIENWNSKPGTNQSWLGLAILPIDISSCYSMSGIEFYTLKAGAKTHHGCVALRCGAIKEIERQRHI
jgi:hypothetical protein